MADLHISSEAEADLDEIWLYVAQETKASNPPNYSSIALPFSFPSLPRTLI